MPEPAALLTFLAASLVVLLLPGPGVLYVVARTAEQGLRAGFASVLGLSAGAYVHVLAAAAGLAALLLTSATAFAIVKALGAGYLVYLGLRTLLVRDAASPTPVLANRPRLQRLFLDGALVSIFNPKIAVFFVAYLPQFVDPAAGPVAAQILFLGLLYVALALVTDGLYAVLTGIARRWIAERLRPGSPLTGRAPRLLCGSLYIGLGLHAAFAGRRA